MTKKNQIQPVRHFENNPREISEAEFKRLQETMKEFGDLSGIVQNLRTGELIGGNQRSEAGQFIGKVPVITEEYEKPLPDGTIAVGYFEMEGGRRFNYRAVLWDDDKALRANLIANAGGGHWDWDALAHIPQDVLIGTGFGKDMLGAEKMNVAGLRAFIGSLESADADRPAGINVQNQYGVIVICDDERHQETVFNDLTGAGYRVKVVVV